MNFFFWTLDLQNMYVYYRLACSIPLGDEVVLTGGQWTVVFLTTVSRYDKDGWAEDMPSLNQGRWGHGCTAFMSGGEQVRLT